MQRFVIPFILLILIIHSPLFAQVDSLQALDPNINAEETDEEFNVFLSVFGLMAIAIMGAMSILTVLLIGLILLFVFFLIAAGVLSISTGVGLYKKSVSAALKTGLYLVSALICAIGGSALAWIIIELFDISVSLNAALITGGIAGALGGVLGALCLIGITQIIFRKFRQLA